MRRVFWSVCIFFLGCGRPVTEQECSEIVARIAELELKEAAAGADIAAEVKKTQAAFRGDAMKNCVGKRVTDDALACVRAATTAKQIVDECFD